MTMTLTYEKIIAETFNYAIGIPECPNKGAFEIAFEDRIYFILNGKLHREDGPAIILSDGSEFYFQNGEQHRENGPAEIWADGTQEHYHLGKLHREDGPAIIWFDGYEEYFLFDQKYEKEEWEPLAIQLKLKEQIL